MQDIVTCPDKPLTTLCQIE